MTNFSEKDLLIELIEMAKTKKIKAFSPIIVKTKDLKTFKENIALKLSETQVEIVSVDYGGYLNPPPKKRFLGSVIELTNGNKTVSYFLNAVQNRLKTIENE